MQLNDDQRRVVESDRHCLVVACPGSGKTRVITTKIGAIFKRRPASRVMAVTFTRESATELARRTVEEIGQTTFDKQCRVGTFHALAIRHLKLNKVRHRLIRSGAQFALIKQASAAHELSYEEAVAIIDKAKGSLDPCPEHESPVYLAYQQALKRHGVVDLTDVILMSVEGMRAGKIPPYPITDMLVDEFQDTDNLQLAWVLAHAEVGVTITVVGDDDQSIYSWRGANGYSGMQAFQSAVGADLITLSVNYRCRKEILSHAGNLIGRSRTRIDKALFAFRGPGGAVSTIRSPTQDTEAQAVLQALQPHLRRAPPDSLFERTVPAGNWAVLARTRRQLDLIESLLVSSGIEVYRPPKESFWAREPQSHLLHLLESLTGRTTSSLESTLEFALRKRFGVKRAQMVVSEVSTLVENDYSRLLIGDGIPCHERIAPDERALLEQYMVRIGSWRDLINSERINLSVLGIANWLCEFESGERQRNALNSGASTLCKIRGTLGDRIKLVSGLAPKLPKSPVSDQDSVSSAEAISEPPPSGVQLQTMHGSKGLEFDNVWIIGADARTIPSKQASDLDEERRLMYVAMTRAKDRLWISWTSGVEPSVFIADAGLRAPALV